MKNQVSEKYSELTKFLKGLQKVAVAFSGGVDSTFLLSAASKALGANVMAFTFNSPYIPNWEVEEAKEITKRLGIKHVIIKTGVPESIKDNPPERCYLCKKLLFETLKQEAKKYGIDTIVEGTNSDDLKDYRPGMKALDELKIVSPLREASLTKNEIRELSKKFNLPTWNKPAYACLMTRIPYNTHITTEELTRIEEGEKHLFKIGMQGARLRSHGDLARIEFRDDQINMISDKDTRDKIVKKLKSIGYHYVCIDLEGYRMGSFNKTIDQNSKK